jgi:hypothetical protein
LTNDVTPAFNPSGTLHRLIIHWVYGGTLAGILLFALTPLIAASWPPYLLAAWIQLPIYMLHQLEEHDADRFRTFVNRNLAGGRNVLDVVAVFVINVPGVWGVMAVSVALSAFVRPGLALIAVYLVLVNALAHIGAWIVLRRYNPGLVTAITLFIPVAVWGFRAMDIAGVGWIDHTVGLLTAVLIHAAIVAYVQRRKRLLPAL